MIKIVIERSKRVDEMKKLKKEQREITKSIRDLEKRTHENVKDGFYNLAWSLLESTERKKRELLKNGIELDTIRRGINARVH